MKTGRKQGNIFHIGLNSTSTSSVLAYVKYRIENRQRIIIVTPNPEIILASTHDQKLKNALNRSELTLPDGIGLAQANRFLTLKAPKNIILRLSVCLLQGLIVGLATFVKKDWLTNSLNVLPGRKVFLELISLANRNSWKVFLLGGYGEVSAKVAGKLGKKYKKVKFEFSDGPKLNKDAEPDTEVDVLIQKICLERINKFKPELLFVALGPTKQEKWVFKNLTKLSIGGAMTVGGTFNYMAGNTKLPPRWMENLGLEWIWRLITEPRRVSRIFNAVVVFPIKVFWLKVTQG